MRFIIIIHVRIKGTIKIFLQLIGITEHSAGTYKQLDFTLVQYLKKLYLIHFTNSCI